MRDREPDEWLSEGAPESCGNLDEERQSLRTQYGNQAKKNLVSEWQLRRKSEGKR